MMESPDGFLLVPELYSVQREDVTAEEVRRFSLVINVSSHGHNKI